MKQYLRRIIGKAADALDYPATDFTVEHPNLDEHGNYSTNIALTLTKHLRRNPMEIAQSIVDAL